jgi:2-C-methyl-D-erythritol 2,4-cyclodiphosphate synthase
MLGGAEIPYSLGLEGHSDADVLTHAVMDALLGAAAHGRHRKTLFPDSDDRYLGISSLKLLSRSSRELLAEGGWRVENIDATISPQRPKLAPYEDADAPKISPIRSASRSDRVSVKATTEEGLGFTGEGRGHRGARGVPD